MKLNLVYYKDFTPELAKAGCFVIGMPNEDYHAYEAISKSGLDLVDKSPLHYLAGVKPKDKRHLEIGTALHTAVLEPERFRSEYMILKGVTKRTASEYKEAVKAKGSERVLTETEGGNIVSTQEAIRNDAELNDELEACDLFEVSAFVEVEGVLWKCRFDALNSKELIAIDLKTTQCSEREDFAKSVYNYRYHVQASFYSAIFRQITGQKLKAFRFLAVENEPPHCPMMYTLDDEAMQIGGVETERNLAEYYLADDTSNWVGYEQTNEPLALPHWAIAQHEQKMGDMIK